MTVSDLAMWTAKRQPVHACESQRHRSRSADLQTSRRDQARDTTWHASSRYPFIRVDDIIARSRRPE
jgi:hypothetical protein